MMICEPIALPKNSAEKILHRFGSLSYDELRFIGTGLSAMRWGMMEHASYRRLSYLASERSLFLGRIQNVALQLKRLRRVQNDSPSI